MADYTTTPNVQALLPKDVQVDETTDPTLAQVGVWITQVSGRLDLALTQGGYTAPSVDATELLAFDLICAQEVAWMVLYRNNAAASDHEWHTTFEEELVRIIGVLGATATNVVHAPSSRTLDAEDESSAASIRPKFSWDKKY